MWERRGVTPSRTYFMEGGHNKYVCYGNIVVYLKQISYSCDLSVLYQDLLNEFAILITTVSFILHLCHGR